MIGGNITAEIQVNTGTGRNAIGECVETWVKAQEITGWLDYSGGNSNYTAFDAKIQESTHVFICDYVELDSRIKAESSRIVCKGHMYDVLVIDNPMELNAQLEIFLKFTGGQ